MHKRQSRIILGPQVFLYQADDERPCNRRPMLGLAQIRSPAFGDGSHPTTRLCAIAVDLICRTERISSFLDVGTGSGVLARIARARGVPFVAATDIDPVALEVARHNAGLDHKLQAIEFKNAEPDHWGQRFDLLAANILEGPLHDLAPAMTRALLPGGQLLLSGFTRLQCPNLRVLYQNLGFQVLSESEQQGWVLLHLLKS
jgi:ribosomal protein L11 methyltransferase